MESTRQEKIARLIQKEMATRFLEEGRSHYKGALITVTKVHITRDLGIARIYLSLFTPTDHNSLLDDIRLRQKEFRGELGRKLRNQLRVIPELQFYIDDSLDYIDNIERLLKS